MHIDWVILTWLDCLGNGLIDLGNYLIRFLKLNHQLGQIDLVRLTGSY